MRWVSAVVFFALVAMGQLASAANVVVNSTDDPASFNAAITVAQAQAAATVTLRDAVNATNNAGGTNTITFDPSLAGQTIVLKNSVLNGAGNLTAFQPKSNLTIQGLTGNSGVTLDGGGALRLIATFPGATLTINDLTLANGSADTGGAIINIGTLFINRCTFIGNTCVNGGGALFNGSRAGTTGTLTNCTITGNKTTASFGAPGAGIYSDSTATLTLMNVTISENTAPKAVSGAGLYVEGSTASLTNTIVVGNAAAGTASDISVANNGNQFGSISGTSNIVNAQAVDPNATGLVNAQGNPNYLDITDAGLRPLGNYGGPTQTYAIKRGAEAFDIGTANGAPATDQRGVARPQFNGVDIGAYEYDLQPDIAVKASNTTIAYGGALFDFGTQNADGTIQISILGLQVTNPGTADLTNISITFGGANPGDFQVSSVSGNKVLANNGTPVTFGVGFKPTAGGPRSATIQIASNALGPQNPYLVTVTGTGNAAPVLTLPASPLVVEATSANGAVVIFAADSNQVSANDPEDGALTPSIFPASGSTFPLGDTTVYVSATDSGNFTTADSFTVHVQDTTPPDISVPFATVNLYPGNIANYIGQAVTSDAVGVTSVVQSPIAGTPVTAGIVPVTLTAYDAAGNFNTATFNLDVRDAALTATPVLATGAAAPGQGTNGLPGDAKIVSFGPPATDDAGDLAYLAQWTSATGGKGTGLFLNSACLAVTGGDASGVVTTATAKWKSFTDPVVNSGNLACIAKLSGVPAATASVVVSGNAGSGLGLIAQTGDVAPDLISLKATGAKFTSFTEVALNGSIAFLAKVSATTGGDNATAAKGVGLWLRGFLPVQFVLGQGDTRTGKTIKTLVAFSTGNGSPGQGRGTIFGTGLGVMPALALFTDKSSAIVSTTPAFISPGTVTIEAQTGTAGDDFSPALSGAKFASFSFPATNNADVAFLGSLAVGPGGVTAANQRGIFLSDPAKTSAGPYTAVARVGLPAGSTGATFSVLKDPVLASDGSIAFPATLKGGSIKGLAATTLWWQPSDGALTLLAQGGQRPGLDLPSTAQWKSFTSLAIGAGRGPIFTGTLVTGGNVTAANASGVWACDFTGAVRTLFRTGDPGPTQGVTLKSFTLLKATVGSTGVTRSFNDAGQIAWLATYSDKSQAIVVTTIP